LDHEDERPLRCDSLEEPPPAGEGLAALRRLASRGELRAGERGEPRREPLALARLGTHHFDRGAVLLRRLGRFVRLEDPGVLLHDLAERPERDPLAVGEAAPLAPSHLLWPALDEAPELADEPRLADAGLADDRDELDRALPERAGKRALEHCEVLVAPDERRGR